MKHRESVIRTASLIAVCIVMLLSFYLCLVSAEASLHQLHRSFQDASHQENGTTLTNQVYELRGNMLAIGIMTVFALLLLQNMSISLLARDASHTGDVLRRGDS